MPHSHRNGIISYTQHRLFSVHKSNLSHSNFHMFMQVIAKYQIVRQSYSIGFHHMFLAKYYFNHYHSSSFLQRDPANNLFFHSLHTRMPPSVASTATFRVFMEHARDALL
ncbi:hypothetical protein RF11_06865 [Thelohanellus kitauei]|uniref:Uncharacterized protein n=1 Tax=Thelohanellus kitauei TaxID=669202 RepID=A0A0C2MD51_THEKT|nr:hypothetical protein RF11_06865 [Thelohanellus kitauei]